MNLYAIKTASAVLNFLVVSFVVRELSNALAQSYLLVLSYVVLGALIVGFGFDTGAERYTRRLLLRWSRANLLVTVLTVSVLRTVLLYGFVLLVNSLRPGLLEISSTGYALALVIFFYTTLTAVLNGALLFISSATSYLIRAALRFLIFVLPVGMLSLDVLLMVEVFAAGMAALFCTVVFLRAQIELSGELPTVRRVTSFLFWNYLSRLFLNVVSLNTVKILILRSNMPNAVLFAYAIQLTEAIEKFLPSFVLKGRYGPELSKIYDEKSYSHMRRRMKALGLASLLYAVVIAVLHLAFVPLAFIVLQDQSPADYWTFIGMCAVWLIMVNLMHSLSVVSNALEADHIQFVGSAVMTGIFAATFGLFSVSTPLVMLMSVSAIMAVYPLVWSAMAARRLRQIV